MIAALRNWRRRPEPAAAASSSRLVLDRLADELGEVLAGASRFSDTFARITEHHTAAELGVHIELARIAALHRELVSAGVPVEFRAPAVRRLLEISDRDVLGMALSSLVAGSTVPGCAPRGVRA